MSQDSSPRPELIYLAGLIDGEGYVGMQKGRNKKSTYYYPTIQIGMSDKAAGLLDQIHYEFGGTVQKHRKETDLWRAAISWVISGQPAINLLVQLQPWLVLKKQQATELLLAADIIGPIPEGRQRRKWTPALEARIAEIHQSVKKLNLKGPVKHTEPAEWTETPFARLDGNRWVTPQKTLFQDQEWQEYLETFPASGSMRNGSVSERPTWAPATAESGFSSRPTPDANAMNDGETPETFLARREKLKANNYNGNGAGTPLTVATVQWRTPDAPGSGGPRNRQGSQGAGHQITIAEQAEHWATPNVPNGGRVLPEADVISRGATEKGKRQVGLEMESLYWRTPAACSPNSLRGSGQDPELRAAQGHTVNLQDQVSTWRTPNTRDHHAQGPRQDAEQRQITLVDQVNDWDFQSSPTDLPTPAGKTCWCNAPGCALPSHKRKLNPIFVTWLMGWPMWWLTGEPQPYVCSAMASYLSRQQSRLWNLLGE